MSDSGAPRADGSRPLLGELLVDLGRVARDDLERALAFQQAHGGYLGDALIQLGALTREELRWSLASQHSLPFVQLHADSIDPTLAAHVPAGWAREHLVLPVLRSGDAVTVVVSDPADVERAEEVRRMTGAGAVDVALSTPERIAELIDGIYGHAVGPEIGVRALLAEALGQGAIAVGISARQGRAVGWYRVAESVHRALHTGWEAELRDHVHPPTHPEGVAGGPPRAWKAVLRAAGPDRAVECSEVRDGASIEWVARITGPAPADAATARLDPRVAAWARGADRMLVRVRRGPEGSPDAQLTEAAAALLPGLLAGRDVRSIHLSDGRAALPPGVLRAPATGDLVEDLAAISAFEPEAVTVVVDRLAPGDPAAIAAAARIGVVLLREGDAPPAEGSLDLYLSEEDGLLWTPDGAGDGED